MRKTNHNTEVMDNLKECGVLTCPYFVGGYCSNHNSCIVYEQKYEERILEQEY
ncbi:MAG: hypothetical protein ACOYVK_05880 [Bacillota bacterium]